MGGLIQTHNNDPIKATSQLLPRRHGRTSMSGRAARIVTSATVAPIRLVTYSWEADERCTPEAARHKLCNQGCEGVEGGEEARVEGVQGRGWKEFKGDD